jgi:hypothetical protein
MNKEKFMQFISESIDNGAKVEVGFYFESNFTEEEAKEKIEEFAQIVEGEAEEAVSSDGKTRWFKVSGKCECSIFHQNSRDQKHFKRYLEEDVDLSGSETIGEVHA